MANPLGFYVALQSTGIIDIVFDPSKSADKSLSLQGVHTNAGHMPGWLAGGRSSAVYSISRDKYPSKEGPSESGGIFVFQTGSASDSLTSSPKTPVLDLVSHASSYGKGGVHCEISPDGKLLAAANITASTLVIYQLSQDGAVESIAQVVNYGLNEPDLKDPHPHQVAFHPSGRYLFVPLRSGDRLDIYSINDSSDVLTKVESVTIPGPAGSRHVAFNIANPNHHFVYLLSEKDNTIRVFAIHYTWKDTGGIKLEALQTLSTLGPNLAPTPPSYHKDVAAEVAVSFDGRFVYASNRGIEKLEVSDTIAVYSIDPSSKENHLTFLKLQNVQGKHPRMFALSKDWENRWVAVANQWTQEIVVFERDCTTGLLGDVKGRISVKGVVSLDAARSVAKCADAVLSRDEASQARNQGPVCVLWK